MFDDDLENFPVRALKWFRRVDFPPRRDSGGRWSG
jgi:hypothetical protein